MVESLLSVGRMDADAYRWHRIVLDDQDRDMGDQRKGAAEARLALETHGSAVRLDDVRDERERLPSPAQFATADVQIAVADTCDGCVRLRR